MIERYTGEERLASLAPTTLKLFDPTPQEKGRWVSQYQDMERVVWEILNSYTTGC